MTLSSPKRPRLLHVEDDPSDARVVRAFLQGDRGNLGDYVHVDRLDRALEELGKGHVDVVLIDLGLPDSQGIETVRRVTGAFPSTPLVVLTGVSDEETAREAIQQGAQDYLVKGNLSAETLVRTLRHAIERQAARDALALSQQRYRQIVELASEGIWTLDSEGSTTFVNERMADMLGYQPSEMIGRPFVDFVDDDTLVEVRTHLALLKPGINHQIDFRLRRKQGSEVWAIVSAASTVDSAGRPIGTHAMVTDITARKLLEEQTQTDARQQAVIAELGIKALSGVAVAALIEETVRIVANSFAATYCEVVQYLPESDSLKVTAGVGWDQSSIESSPLEGGMRAQAAYTLQTGGPVVVEDLRFESRFHSALLAEQGVVSGLSVVIPGEKKPWGVLGLHTCGIRQFSSYDVNSVQGIAHVIAEAILRSKTEEALRKSEERYEIAVRGSEAGLWDWDLVTSGAYFAPRFRELLGYTYDEFPDEFSSFLSVLHPDDDEPMKESLRRHFRERRSLNFEYRMRHKSGEYRWFNARGEALRDSADRVYRMAGSVMDITDRRKAQETIAQQAALLDQVRAAIMVYDREERVTFWNKGAERLYGWIAAEAVGRDLSEVVRLDPADLALMRERLAETGEWIATWNHQARDGRPLVVESRTILVRDADGKPRSTFAINTEVTERKSPG